MSSSSPVGQRRPRRGLVAAAVVLSLLGVGALVALAGQTDRGGEPAGRPGAGPADSRGGVPATAGRNRGGPPPPPVLLVRRIGELPDRVVSRTRALAGTRVSVGLARRVTLRRSRSSAGRVVDSPPPGFGVPLELAAVEPRTYAPLINAGPRDAVLGLGAGEALLTRTSARLRRLGPGGRIQVEGGRSLRVVGVVDDEVVRHAEIVVNAREGTRLGARRRWALVPYKGDPGRLVAALRDAGGPELRVRDLGRPPWPRFLQILPQAVLKHRFGEFAVRLDRGDEVVVEPSWVERKVVGASVPILGSVRCHREMIPALRRAMAELERRGLERLVDRGDYAGCFAAKDIPSTGAVSRHAWGLAIDLNAAANPYGERSTQDPRLLEVMERNGFAWGGRWPTPDAMHFEYVGDEPSPGA